jgi:glucuronoarabinoxylan endo-1,4-beta-xylanase
VTNSFERIPKVLTLLALLFAASAAKAQTATINWNDQHQVIDGFGASDIFSPLSPSQAQFFFSSTPGTGLGFSLLRSVVDYYGDCTSISSTCATGTYSGLEADIGYAKQYGVKYWATSPSPPPSMSTNGGVNSCSSGGNNELIASQYANFATYLSNWVASTITYEGITPLAISVQNEPDYCPSSYEGALWSASQFDSFIAGSLGPTMTSAGQMSATQIMFPETSQWGNLQSYAGICMGDSNCSKYVGIVAAHDYDNYNCAGNPSGCGYAAAQNLGKHLWETEVTNLSSCVTGIGDALIWAQDVHNWLVVGNANAWNYYLYVAGTQVDGLICPNGTTRTAAYALGNYSLFIRPGYYRIDTGTGNPQGGVYVSAFQNTSGGNLVIVAINTSQSSISQTFSIANSPNFTTVTPWITSASLNLAQQSAVPVNANSFTYSLPASSITSFVGSTGSTAPSAPQQSSVPAPPVITSIAVK